LFGCMMWKKWRSWRRLLTRLCEADGEIEEGSLACARDDGLAVET